ncbi:MAG: VWA domain-containing protein [Anaerolineae bacterium]|nr:VWA domain-containing protein [Anaerolineae bacterium]
MNTAIIPGSLGALAKQEGKSLAESFVNADLIVIVDTSGSMSSNDSKNGKSRYETACEELAALQENHPGKIAVLSFSNEVIFCPSGIPTNLGGGTDMAKALQFAKIADVPGMQFILISDGEPDDETKTLQVARTYQNKISTIYVGPEERPTGRDFLQRLAAATGGQTITVDRARELKAGIEKLYLPG